MRNWQSHVKGGVKRTGSTKELTRVHRIRNDCTRLRLPCMFAAAQTTIVPPQREYSVPFNRGALCHLSVCFRQTRLNTLPTYRPYSTKKNVAIGRRGAT